MRGVSVYIEGKKLDLFSDEQIVVKSTQQNVQDISKVFTDFSQSFTVPASPKNNAIFEHFYQNDVNNTFDFNLRRNANIEIDLTPFRSGKMSLENSEVKNNKPLNYQITFYGETVSLKDKFGNDKLTDVSTINDVQHTYTGTEVKNRVIDGSTDYTIRYPLIFNRDVTYGDGGDNDLNDADGAVRFNELFPAIKLSTVFSSIATHYGLTFTGTFLSAAQFTKAFLRCQNSDTFVFTTPPVLANITSLTTASGNNNNALVASSFFSIANDTLTISQFDTATNFPTLPSSFGSFVPFFSESKHKVFLFTSNVSDANVVYYIDVYSNGQRIQTLDASGATSELAFSIQNNELNTPRTFQFFVRSTQSITLDLTIQYRQKTKYTYVLMSASGVAFLTSEQLQNVFLADCAFNITSVISVTNYLPDITVEKFFKGILEMFNLTCYSTVADTYQIEPITDWYSKGAVVDITEYTDIESIKVDRIKLYKNIEFKYEESESAVNTIFKTLTGREYGNTRVNFDYDGGDFKIELPFENMQMQKFTGTNLQIGETINEDGNKTTPKPMILYMYEQQSATYHFDTGSDTTQSAYVPFGQDLLDSNINYTLNFNQDISPLLDTTVPNTLYNVYYSQYLSNLYNLKNRETSVKTNLPISLLTNLELNDRVIIRDKRYIINDMSSNLTNGDVDFVLLNDLSDVVNPESAGPLNPLNPSSIGQTITFRVLFPNGAASAAITTSDAGVSISPSSLTAEAIVGVTIPANTDTVGLITDEAGTSQVNTESFIALRTEAGNEKVYNLSVTYTFPDGTTSANSVNITQQDR